MAKFRTKPVIKEAFRFRTDPHPEWFRDAIKAGKVISYPLRCHIETLEGIMHADAGDWIVQGLAGELYPCKPEIFARSYEAVDG